MESLVDYIYKNIVVLSDIELQKKLWLNQNNDTGLISSYTELMCSLFDDFGFDDFVEKESSNIGLSKSLIFELSKLKELLNNYVEKETDEDIINDSEWERIILQSNIVKELWKIN